MQQRERDELRRQDLASELAQLGLAVDWQQCTADQLVDWRDRLRAALALKVQHGLDVDWRMQSLTSLVDLRLRAAKAAELGRLYGVHVEWQRYSWQALESMRVQLSRLNGGNRSTRGDERLAQPRFRAMAEARPGIKRDPDVLLEPTFALNTAAYWSFGTGHQAGVDPDAIIMPTFVAMPAGLAGPDDIIEPWFEGAAPPGH